MAEDLPQNSLSGSQLSDSEFLEKFRQVTHKIDAKGRVSVPPAFRFETDALRYVICADPFAPRLQIRSLAWVRALHTALTTREDISTSQGETYLEDLFHGLTELKLDAEGRVMLNQAQLSHAGLTTEVLFIGAGDHVQIWNPVIRKSLRHYGSQGANKSLDDLIKTPSRSTSELSAAPNSSQVLSRASADGRRQP